MIRKFIAMSDYVCPCECGKCMFPAVPGFQQHCLLCQSDRAGWVRALSILEPEAKKMIGRISIVEFKPLPDITAYELALSLNVRDALKITGAAETVYDELPSTVQRHFHKEVVFESYQIDVGV